MSLMPDDSEASDSGSFAPSTFQGYLQKKSPRGFLGKHMWQRRWFVIENGNLSYYKEKKDWAKGDKPIGVVRINMIRDIQLPLESSHYGLRFDILAVGGHLFELMAPSEKSCTQWVRALREEIGKRGREVNEAIKAVKDEQVADGFWKSKEADDVRKLHNHAEAAVPSSGRSLSRQPSRANSRANSRESSRSRTFEPDDDEETRDRAAALAAMMEEDAARKQKENGGKPLEKERVIMARSSSMPTQSSHPDPEDEPTQEEKAADFLKKQYTLGAVKAGGRSALRSSIITTSAADLDEIEAQLPRSERGAARTMAGMGQSERNLRRQESNRSEDSPKLGPSPSTSPATAAGATVGTPQSVRRPIASYGSDDSDEEENEGKGRSASRNGAAAGAQSPEGAVRVHTGDTDQDQPGASSPAAAAAISPAAALAAMAAAEENASPFISSILWKESPSGFVKVWQKRLFALQDGVVCYYRKVDAGLTQKNLAGTISIHQITKILLVPDQKKGKATDFNLLTTEGRVYKLRSESESVTQQWIAFLQACDPKRLGCTFPGLVVRESNEQQMESAANGEAPRGRLVATGKGKTVVSVLPNSPGSKSSSAATATAEIPATPGEKRAARRAAAAADAAAEEIVEEKTFWNFLRNKHSLLSIFFVKKKAAFPRLARWVLFVLDLLMNLCFVYVFIIDGRLSAVQQVFLIIFLLIIIEMIIAAFLKWFCYDRGVGPVEQQIRLGICTLLLYGLFVSLTAWQWTRLPENVAIIALVRFIASSIGVIFAEIAVWFLLYSFAQQCCPCIKLDDGSKSLEDIQAEEEEAARLEKERERAEAIKERRAKMQGKMRMKGVYRADEEV